MPSLVATSHSRTVPSHDPEARVAPSDENDTDTDPICMPFERGDSFSRRHIPKLHRAIP